MESPCLSAEATSLKPAIWKQGVSKRGNLKRPIYHFMNFKSQIFGTPFWSPYFLRKYQKIDSFPTI